MRRYSLVLTLSSFALVAATASAAPNLIVNGGFESTPAPTNGYSQYLGGQSFGGWTATGSDVLVIDSGYTEQGSGGPVSFVAQEGRNSLDITGAGNTSSTDGINQSIATLVGQRYSLSFYVGRTDADPNDPRYNTPSTIDLSIDGGSRQSFTNSSLTSGGVNWHLFTTSFVATGTSTNIAFLNGTPPVPAGNNFAGLDNVSVVATPGPSSLVSFGVTGLAMFRRRRRAARRALAG